MVWGTKFLQCSTLGTDSRTGKWIMYCPLWQARACTGTAVCTPVLSMDKKKCLVQRLERKEGLHRRPVSAGLFLLAARVRVSAVQFMCQEDERAKKEAFECMSICAS